MKRTKDLENFLLMTSSYKLHNGIYNSQVLFYKLSSFYHNMFTRKGVLKVGVGSASRSIVCKKELFWFISCSCIKNEVLK